MPARSDSLELALAVYRAPMQRFSLIGKPLPQDIGVAIQLASGNPSLLHEAAERCGEREGTILEASRFYLQQVLFAPDADAYRLLGLTSEAPAERIRKHYHWLQRWLHPDRRGEEWEALLASRVNSAWRELRSQPSRRAYGTRNEAHLKASPIVPRAIASLPTGEWTAVPVQRLGHDWPKRIVLAIPFAGCVGLLYLALIHDESRPLESAVVGSSAAGLPTAVDELQGRKKARDPNMDAGADTAPAPGSTLAAAAPDTAAEPPPTAPAGPIVAAQPASARPRASATGPAERVSRPVSAKASPSSLAAPVVALNASGMAADHHRMPDRSTLAGSAEAETAAEEHSLEIVARQDSAATPGDHASVAPKSVDTPAGALALQVPAPAVENRNLAETGSPGIHEKEQASRDRQAPKTAFAINRSTTFTDPLARIDLARRRLAEIADYFGGVDALPPPVWNDAGVELVAENQRNAIHDRSRLRAIGDFAVDAPAWTMSDKAAALNAKYHLGRGRQISESGHLALDMVWREDTWLVTRVDLEPTP